MLLLTCSLSNALSSIVICFIRYSCKHKSLQRKAKRNQWGRSSLVVYSTLDFHWMAHKMPQGPLPSTSNYRWSRFRFLNLTHNSAVVFLLVECHQLLLHHCRYHQIPTNSWFGHFWNGYHHLKMRHSHPEKEAGQHSRWNYKHHWMVFGH